MAAPDRSVTVAHLLFLVAGLGPLVTGIANLVPMSTGTAGGVGLLVLVPLSLAGFAATIAGMIRTVRLRGRPRSLVVLAVLSVLYVAAFFAAESVDLPQWLSRAVPLALGIAIVALALRGLILARHNGPRGS